MRESPFTDADFLVGWCASCAREVLTWADYDADEVEARRCVHCETPVSAQLHSAKGSDLARHGYSVIEPKTCGSGGCGSGRCGRPATPATPSGSA